MWSRGMLAPLQEAGAGAFRTVSLVLVIIENPQN